MEDVGHVKNAEIIVIGDELLSGETVDTNSNYLDGEFEGLGWQVSRHTTVPDDIDKIAKAIDEASRRAKAVICSGGLGPTQDDLTLEALARALGCGLRQDEAVLSSIQEKFSKIGRTMSPNNARQSFVPELGEVIDNPVGTAPAFTAKLHDAQVFLLPGVYPEDTNGVFQALGAAGFKATIPNQNFLGRSYFKNNDYLKCNVVDYSDASSFFSIFPGPSDEGNYY